MNRDKHPKALIISGFDPSGGAGLIADIETVHALGCRASAVITCQTIQTEWDATACVASDSSWFRQQLHSILKAYSFSVIKIGLTPSLEIIEILAHALPSVSCPIVLDPIIAAGGGYPFCNAKTIAHLSEKLIPLCDLATPNAEELRRLAGTSDDGVKSLLERGCKAVLVSSEYERAGYLYHNLYSLHHPPHTFTAKRLPHRYHGSGCTLASAIAAYLAHGKALVEAVRHAQEFTSHCLSIASLSKSRVAVPNRFKQ
ncbi:MAG: hydroxymethylpyrimidine/phosphomethylpyrimidine kinase [Chromatiales bacterium]|nr:hydroxymethylpyrimidine/phosphomethylpyrimidine kinase [Chromatiales bacterium]